ncbi:MULTISPECIES: alpha/beta fold hydrolase [unclassified Vibrio]|uniref:Alpha/beta fold hydrolase n=1 Tax=Vibrio sp. HB236076 TaxID=3232307 RepID=A0AB39HDR4_9VIBR|nr:alpha/beta fold hydrolase [Vibrio sp. HB161653]MDP5255042.1 alpha/beta fold hydrolase [Vibrio sp. HB161653]
MAVNIRYHVSTLLGCLFLIGCDVPPYDKAHMLGLFNETTRPQSEYVQESDRKMHYVVNPIIDEHKKHNIAIVFVHGAPGDWLAFASYLADPDLSHHALMASVDRLGYGKSQPGRWEVNLSKQAALLHQAILDIGKEKRVILVGHSFGGPVIARLAMDYPESVDQLLILAGSVDPSLEFTKWFQYIADWHWVRPLIPAALNVTNQEILPLKGQLEVMLPLWDKITAPITVIQGTNDKLVPHQNAAFIKQKVPSATVIYLNEQNHFLPWNEFDLIKQTLIDMMAVYE